MRTTPPIYQYTGLIAGLGLASLLIGFVILLTVGDLQLAAWIILGLGVLLLTTAAVIDFRKVKGAVTGKRGRFSAGNTVMVSIFVGIIVLINAISINFNAKIDVTELSQFTLTSQTKDYLADLTVPVDVICFFTPNDSYGIGDYAKSLLDEYSNYTDMLTIKTIDPDEHPDEANKYNIYQYQTVVFESEIGRRSVAPEEIYAEAEHSFTSAILEVTGTVQKKVYYLTGHGEAAAEGEYAYATLALMDNLYKVDSLDLMVEQDVPDDCSVLIIPGPRSSFTALEMQILGEYLDNDGTVLLLINPDCPEDIQTLLADWYLSVEDGTIIEESSYSGTKDSPIIPRTQNEVFGLTEIYFPGAAAINTIEGSPDNLIIAPLFYTSAASWVDAEFDPTEAPKFNEAIEELGARAVGVLVTYQEMEDSDGNTIPVENEMQLIVVGDSDFASNSHFYNAENAYQFLYLVEYLTQGEQLVTVERKVLPYRSLVITSDQETFIRIASIGLLPLIVLIIGGVIWWRRR